MCKSYFPRLFAVLVALVLAFQGCAPCPEQSLKEPVQAGKDAGHRLVVLDPGHFHAALVFKRAGYQGVSPLVGIYAPVGDDFVDHMGRVTPFNTRSENPASWDYQIRLAPDFEKIMLEEKFGDIAVLSGKNAPKVDRILACVKGGFNVLADKPWVIDAAKLPVLEQVIAEARSSGKVVYDIMTERHEITTILQRMIVADQATFGTVVQGSPEDPALVKKSVHHLYKLVAGKPNKRPWWFFDTGIQGEGLVDVTTHLVDMTFWTLFPDQPIDYKSDIEMVSAGHWSTEMTRAQFEKVTGLPDFPPQFELDAKGKLAYFCNGRMNFKLRGINVSLEVVWNFQAPEGTGDTHFSIIKGTRAHVLVQQGPEQSYRPELYVRPAPGVETSAVAKPLEAFIAAVNQGPYQGVSAVKEGSQWRIDIPDKYRIGHEAHFGQVTDSFLRFLEGEPLPDWEYTNLMAKYYVTTSALELCRKGQ
jgi:predicted dehydrogenase